MVTFESWMDNVNAAMRKKIGKSDQFANGWSQQRWVSCFDSGMKAEDAANKYLICILPNFASIFGHAK